MGRQWGLTVLLRKAEDRHGCLKVRSPGAFEARSGLRYAHCSPGRKKICCAFSTRMLGLSARWATSCCRSTCLSAAAHIHLGFCACPRSYSLTASIDAEPSRTCRSYAVSRLSQLTFIQFGGQSGPYLHTRILAAKVAPEDASLSTIEHALRIFEIGVNWEILMGEGAERPAKN